MAAFDNGSAAVPQTKDTSGLTFWSMQVSGNFALRSTLPTRRISQLAWPVYGLSSHCADVPESQVIDLNYWQPARKAATLIEGACLCAHART